MPEPLQLVAFDYDGTISDVTGDSVAANVLLGIKDLWRANIKTTTITARPYWRLDKVSGGIHRFVSEGTPIATERGARIVDGTRQRNLHYSPLSQDELEAIIETPKTNIDFIGFYSEDLLGPSYIWSPEAKHRDALNAAFGHDAIILASNTGALNRALRTANPCLVTIRFKTSNSANKLCLPVSLNTAWTSKSVSIITNGIDKRTALHQLCLSTGTPLASTLYAGNDENDLPVFALHELKQKILVGPLALGNVTVDARFASPNELGIHFRNISKKLL